MLPKSPVGKKILMAVSGQAMILFIVIHVLGNSTLFFGGLNAYAEKLHSLPLLVWLTRLTMAGMLFLHVFFSIKVTLENRRAKLEEYAVKKPLRSTFASRNMIWTGVVIAAFLIYHLFHFTFQVISPENSAGMNTDASGNPDVAGMVISGFQNSIVSLIYMVAMIALVLHLTHGIQSSFQSLGLNNESTLPLIEKSGSVAAIILFLGYISIPLAILLGMMKG